MQRASPPQASRTIPGAPGRRLRLRPPSAHLEGRHRQKEVIDDLETVLCVRGPSYAGGVLTRTEMFHIPCRTPAHQYEAGTVQRAPRRQRSSGGIGVQMLNVRLDSDLPRGKDRPVYARFKTYNLRIGSVQGREAVARRTRRADAGEVVLPRLDQVAETKISRLVRGLGQRHFRPYAVKGRDIVVEVHQFQPI